MLQPALLIIAGLTMVIGVLGAATQDNIRRILSFHIISQIGYMIMGIALGTSLALIGTVYFLIHNMVVKTNLFLIAGWIERAKGTAELKKIGGLYQNNPWIACLFLLSALALVGLPPLSGFWGKLLLVRSGFDDGQYLIAAVALFVGLLTLVSMTKIWNYAFWKPTPLSITSTNSDEAQLTSLSRIQQWGYFLPILLLTFVTLGLSFALDPIWASIQTIADQLNDPQSYIKAVLQE